MATLTRLSSTTERDAIVEINRRAVALLKERGWPSSEIHLARAREDVQRADKSISLDALAERRQREAQRVIASENGLSLSDPKQKAEATKMLYSQAEYESLRPQEPQFPDVAPVAPSDAYLTSVPRQPGRVEVDSTATKLSTSWFTPDGPVKLSELPKPMAGSFGWTSSR